MMPPHFGELPGPPTSPLKPRQEIQPYPRYPQQPTSDMESLIEELVKKIAPLTPLEAASVPSSQQTSKQSSYHTLPVSSRSSNVQASSQANLQGSSQAHVQGTSHAYSQCSVPHNTPSADGHTTVSPTNSGHALPTSASGSHLSIVFDGEKPTPLPRPSLKKPTPPPKPVKPANISPFTGYQAERQGIGSSSNQIQGNRNQLPIGPIAVVPPVARKPRQPAEAKSRGVDNIQPGTVSESTSKICIESFDRKKVSEAKYKDVIDYLKKSTPKHTSPERQATPKRQMTPKLQTKMKEYLKKSTPKHTSPERQTTPKRQMTSKLQTTPEQQTTPKLQTTPEQKTEMVFNGAQAKCFEKCLQADLQQKIRIFLGNKHGTGPADVGSDISTIYTRDTYDTSDTSSKETTCKQGQFTQLDYDHEFSNDTDESDSMSASGDDLPVQDPSKTDDEQTTTNDEQTKTDDKHAFYRSLQLAQKIQGDISPEDAERLAIMMSLKDSRARTDMAELKLDVAVQQGYSESPGYYGQPSPRQPSLRQPSPRLGLRGDEFSPYRSEFEERLDDYGNMLHPDAFSVKGKQPYAVQDEEDDMVDPYSGYRTRPYQGFCFQSEAEVIGGDYVPDEEDMLAKEDVSSEEDVSDEEDMVDTNPYLYGARRQPPNAFKETRLARRGYSEGDLARKPRSALENSSGRTSSSRQHATQPGFKEDSCMIMQTKVVLRKGEIAEQKTSALVNLMAPSQNIKESIVSRAFCAAGGSDFERMWTNQEFESGMAARYADPYQHVKVTKACGNLPCDYVLHVTLEKVQDQAQMQQYLSRAMKEIFQVCTPGMLAPNGCTYIAMPPLGLGRIYTYPLDLVARCMLTETQTFLQSGQFDPKEVTFVVYDNDAYDAFKTELDSLGGNSGLGPHSRVIPTPRPRVAPVPYSGGNPLPQPKVVPAPFMGRTNSMPVIQPATGAVIQPAMGNILRGNRHKVMEAETEILLDDKETMASRMEASEKRRKNRGRITRGSPEFIEHMLSEDDETPHYWKNYKPGEPLRALFTEMKNLLKDSKHCKVDIDINDPVYGAIFKLINDTFDPSKIGHGRDAIGLAAGSYSRLNVVRIQRIENIDLYKKYARHRNDLFQALGRKGLGHFATLSSLPGNSGNIKTIALTRDVLKKDMYWELNEQLFFHGTKADSVEKICDQGLDSRVGDEKAMFGSGVYAAESATKADQYTDSKKERTYGAGHHKKMLLIRMALGNMFPCKDPNPEKYKRPPCASCCESIKFCNCKCSDIFDSVVGDNGKLFREFVVYSPDHCYPEYLITYERR